MRLLVVAACAGCSFTPGSLPRAGETGEDADVDAPGDAAVDTAMLVADAMIDSMDPPQPTWQVIDTLTVPVNGTQVVSSVALTNGVTYRLRAEGTFMIQDTGTLADAEWWNFGGTPEDGVSGVDVGLAVDDSSVNTTRTPKWGAYQSSHVYEVDWVGDGTTIFAMLHDGNFSNNSGSLTLKILALQ